LAVVRRRVAVVRVVRACRPGPGNCPIAGGTGPSEPNVAHGFWRIETASLIDYPQEGRIVELFAVPAGGWALRLTMIVPDPADPTATLSRRLAVAEASCTTSALLEGPLSSGPYDEIWLNCNPLGPDTDGDGLRDGDEVLYGTDPTQPDTDGNAANGNDYDYVLEVIRLRCGCEPGPDGDRDGDGASDWVELFYGTAPDDPDTDGDPSNGDDSDFIIRTECQCDDDQDDDRDGVPNVVERTGSTRRTRGSGS
jgi:hypothetical protein